MRLWKLFFAACRAVIKSTLKNPGSMVLAVALPVIMIVGLAMVNNLAYDLDPQQAAIRASLNNNGNPKGGAVFLKMLESEPVKRIIELSEEPDIEIRLAPDFDEMLSQGRPTKVTIQEINREGITDSAIIGFMTKETADRISRSFVFDELIRQGSLTQKEAQRIQEGIETSYTTSVFEPVQVEPLRTLSHFEHQAAGNYSVYFFYMVVLTMFQGYIRDKENGVFARLHSTPNTTWQIFNHYFFMGLLFGFVTSLLLMMVLKFTGLAFLTVGPGQLLLVNAILAVTTSALGSFTLIFKNKLVMNIVLMAIMYIQMFFTGSILPSFAQNDLLDKVLDLLPAEMVRNLLIELQLTGSLVSSPTLILSLLAVSLAAYLVGALFVHKTWEAV